MRILAILGLAITAAACAGQPANRLTGEPLQTVNYVDLNQYVGLWYEIARLPNSFEDGCEGVTANYALRSDGLLSVENACRKGAVDGPLSVAKGRARVVDETTNSKLEVSFFGPFWGDYWIIRLEEDYSLAVVSEPKGRYLWILSRTPTLDPQQLEDLLADLDATGFDTSALYFPKQPPAPLSQ